MGGKRKHPFFSASDSPSDGRKRRSSYNATPIRHEEVEFIPVAGTDLSSDRVITFEIVTGNTSVKMYRDPILFSYTMKKEGNAATAADDNLYIDPTLYTASLIRGVEITINNVLVFSDLENLLNCYQAVATRMCCREIQRELTQGEKLLNSTADAAGENSKALAISGGKASVTMVGHLLNVPFLGPSKNPTLESMYLKLKGDPVDYGENFIIPPNTTVVFRFILHDKDATRVFKSDSEIGDVNLATVADPGDGNEVTGPQKAAYNKYKKEYVTPGFKFGLSKFLLRGTKMMFSEREVQNELEKSNLTMVFDRPLGSMHALPPNTQQYNASFQIPTGCSIVYVVFLNNAWVLPEPAKVVGQKPSDCTKFLMPKNLTKIAFWINEQSLLFRTGLDLDVGEPYASHSFRLYYDYLQANGLINEKLSFSSFAPRLNLSGYNNIFVLPLVEFNLRDISRLTVEMTFGVGDHSPKDTTLLAFYPQECALKRKGGNWMIERGF